MELIIILFSHIISRQIYALYPVISACCAHDKCTLYFCNFSRILNEQVRVKENYGQKFRLIFRDRRE